MGANMDEMKGRTKEAAGDLTDDDDLKREGKADRMGATIKDKAEQGGRQGEGHARRGPLAFRGEY